MQEEPGTLHPKAAGFHRRSRLNAAGRQLDFKPLAEPDAPLLPARSFESPLYEPLDELVPLCAPDLPSSFAVFGETAIFVARVIGVGF